MSVSVCVFLQAQCMVYRALANMLVLPWPETSDSRQEWAWRTAELGRVVTGATRVLTGLQQSGQWNQETWLLQQGLHECVGGWVGGWISE